MNKAVAYACKVVRSLLPATSMICASVAGLPEPAHATPSSFAEVAQAVCTPGQPASTDHDSIDFPHAGVRSTCLSPNGVTVFFGSYFSPSAISSDSDYLNSVTYASLPLGGGGALAVGAKGGTASQDTQALEPLKQLGFTTGSGGSSASDSSSSCTNASCVPNLAQNITPNGSCTPQKHYDLGLDSSGATYACLISGAWSSFPTLTGVHTMLSRCPATNQRIGAQSPDGVALVCADGQWVPGDDIPR